MRRSASSPRRGTGTHAVAGAAAESASEPAEAFEDLAEGEPVAAEDESEEAVEQPAPGAPEHEEW